MKLNKIYNENCLDTMKRMPDNFVDLVITSPPYDDLRNYKDYSFDFNKIALELFRVVKQGGVVVWVVNDSIKNWDRSGTSFKQALFFKQIGFKLVDTMIYSKVGALPNRPGFYNTSFEFMFVLSIGKPKTINILKDKPNRTAGMSSSVAKSCSNTQRKRDGTLAKKAHGAKSFITQPLGIRTNIWSYDPGGGKGTKDTVAHEHPAIFPEKLAGDHIKSWSNEGDLVYDPFMGSGTTAKMAHIHNRKWLGSEISAEYCEIARKRIEPYMNKLL